MAKQTRRLRREYRDGTFLLLKCRDKKDKTVRVPALESGESFPRQFRHKWGSAGTKKCTAIVDPENTVDELKEDGNSDQFNVKIKL